MVYVVIQTSHINESNDSNVFNHVILKFQRFFIYHKVDCTFLSLFFIILFCFTHFLHLKISILHYITFLITCMAYCMLVCFPNTFFSTFFFNYFFICINFTQFFFRALFHTFLKFAQYISILLCY